MPLHPGTGVAPQDDPPQGTPAGPLFSLSMLLFGGYRRVSRKTVLGHATRSTLYREIVRQPGSDVATLAEATGTNENTLRYHLMKLVETGTITTLSRPGVVRYFPNQGRYSPFEQVVIHYTRTATPSAILELLSIRQGMTRQDLADALALSGPSVSRQMFSLIDDGIVENRSDGRSNHYFLTKDAYRALERLADGEPAILHHPAHGGENYPCHREETARGPVAALALDRPGIPGI
jgi:predicted transcriptional regulator